MQRLCATLLSALVFAALLGCGNSFTFTGDHTDKNDYALKITPAAPVVTVGHSLTLTATSPWGSGAVWSVLPASLGSIDPNGNFAASATPGQGTVVAMWNNDVRYTATGTLSVVPAPVATLTADATAVINGSFSASVPAQVGSTYQWTILGGVITGGQGTAQIQYTPTGLGTLQLGIAVSNAAGDKATAQASVSVVDVPPAIRYSAPNFTLTRGHPVSAIRPISTGGTPVTWTISPGLPAGLSFDPSTGIITGTPSALSSPATFTVTATNSGGAASITFTLAVIDTAPAIAYNPSTYPFTRGSAIATIVPSSTGGVITSWSVAPALPEGLAFDTTTGRLTGTPAALSAAAGYTVTATNSGGSATALLKLSVVDPVPVIHYDPSVETLVRGADLGSLMPTNTGGPATAWQVTPALPAGLVFNTVSGTVAGTPTTPGPAATFTVTASNSGGTSEPVTLTFTVVDSAPVFSYTPVAYTLTLNAAAPAIAPVLTHGTATSWSIAPNLPPGLTFEPATGRVTGSPTALSPAVSYTVTATNSYGSSTSAALAITVIDTPPVIAYTPSAYSLTLGTAAPTIVPTNTRGTALSWSVTPALPPGLTFDQSTGHISGTPTALSPSATYAVTATNTGGTSAPATLSFAVVDVPPSIGYSPSVFIFTKGQAIAPLVPANNGGAVTSWTISPALPSGLTFDTATGRLTGTPTVLSSAATYTVMASNTGGASTPLALRLSVVDVVPSIAYTTPVTVTVGTSLPTLTPTNSGGAAISWSVQPALPAGVTLDTATGVISGSPTTTLASTAFHIAATNTGGAGQLALLTLTVVAAPTATITASTTTPLYGAPVSLVPTFTGATSATVGSTRGASDISLNSASGVAINTAGITAPHTFWLRATDAAGDFADASVPVTPQTVVVGPISPASPTRTAATTTTFAATVTGGVTNTLSWSATGGTMDAGTGVWTAPGTVGTYTITATSTDDRTKSASTLVSVVAAPSASLTASTSSPAFGATVTLTPVFANAISAVLGTSLGGSELSISATSGTPVTTGAILLPSTFYLRASNAAGQFVDAQVTITPQAVVVGPLFPASPTRTVSTLTNFTATATGGVSDTLTWTTSGGTINASTGAWTAPATPGTYTVTATSTEDLTKSASTTVNVVAAPAAALTASTTTPLFSATVALTPTFANAISATLGTTPGAADVSPSVISGTAVNTVAITTSRTYFLRATNAAGATQDASVTVTPQTVAVAPLSPSAPTRTVSSVTTFSTTATGGVTNTVTWSSTNGSITAAGVWTAPSAAGDYTITATSTDDPTKSASTTVTVVGTPTATLIASTTSPLFGATVSLTPSFTNATGATVGTTPGGRDLSANAVSGVALNTAALTSPRTFYLRATNAAGTTQDASVLVIPQTVVVSPIAPANATRTASGTTTFTATATGGVTNTLTWTATGGNMVASAGVWAAPSAPGTYTITASSTDDPTKAASTTVHVVAAPTAALSASTTSPLFGATVILTPVFANATTATLGSTPGASDVSASVTSGAPVTTAALTTAKTFYLRATNAAGDFADASVTITPQTIVISAITPASPTRTVLSSTTFSATVTGGVTNSLTWSASGGTINASTGVWTAPPTAGTVTITTTSTDDPTKSATTTVTVVAAPTATLTASSQSPLFGATVSLTTTFTNATSATLGTTAGGSDISVAPTSGMAVTTAAITSAKTYYLRATNAAGTSQDASVTVTPQTVLVGPITPASPTRTVASTTIFATNVTGGVTNTVTWSATGGTMVASTGAWTAPATAGNYTITATSVDDPTKSASTIVHVVAAPTAAITASTTRPLFGATVALTPTFANATSAVIGSTPGGSDLTSSATSGTALNTAAITTAKTFYLRSTNAAGDFQDASVTVTPQTVAVSAITPAGPTGTVSTSTTFTATATGGVTNGLTWTANGGTMNGSTGAWTAPSTAGSYTVTATSTDDPTKSASTTVTVVGSPTAAITASTTSPLYGAAVNLTPIFTNATTAVVGTTLGGNDISASPTSGMAVTTAAITSAKTYYLRATNAAGTSQDASVTVTPQTVVISAITKSASNVSVGYTAAVTATVTHAQDTTINWTATGGTFSPTTTASGVASTWTAPTTPGTYTITAKSNADATKQVTTTITVVALPVATSLTPSTTSPLRGATITLVPVFSSGTGSVDQSIGTVTSGTARTTAAITAPITYTLTVTNTGGQTASVASALVTPQTVSVDAPVAAQTVITTGYSQTYTAAVHGAYVTTVTWAASNGTITSAGLWTAPSTPGTYTITATSTSDPTKSNSTTVRVVSPPVISSFVAADPLISMGASTNLTGVFTNGAGTARIGTSGSGSSDLTSAVTSGTALTTGALSATTTFTLTVYNEAGNSTSASVTVTVVAGSSSTTVSLSGPRYAHTSTLLPDGRVLVIGGRNDTAPLATSQIYDPTVPSFSDAGTMANARSGHTATLLPNNTVLVAGGNDGSTLAASELWSGAFASTGVLNTAREKHTATLLLNGEVLLVGGLSGTSPVVTAELYDPSTGSFTYTAGNLNTARYSHTATLLANGKVLIAGGYNGSIPLSSAELFDPSTGAFTVVGGMAQARQRHAAVLLNDGTVAMIGGRGSSAPLTTAEIYNPGTSGFATTQGAMANARDGLAASLVASGKIMVTGGVDATGNPVTGSEIYDPTAKTFGLTALLSVPRTQHTSTLLRNGKVLLGGGLAVSNTSTATAELIDPQDGLTPTLPNATVTAPVGANRAQTGLAASAPSQTHVTYVWMITGGSIAAGQGTNAITFSMPLSGTATLDLLVTSDRLVPSHTQFVVTPKPVISAFAPARATVTVGTATTLNWTVQDATSLSIDQGVGTVTGTSASVTDSTLGSTIYTLTATNAGGSTTATTTINAVPAPVATSLTPASTTVPVGGNTTLIPIFSQGTGAITPSIGAVSSGPAYPTPAISSPTTFTLTVTNAAGDTATQTATINLQPVSVTSVNGPAYLTAGHTGIYTATVSGSVSTSVNWSTSAGSVDGTGHLTAPLTAPYNTTQTPLTLTATSVNGGTSANTTVQIVPLPSITSFTAASSSVGYGATTTITPVFTLGTGQIVGLGSVTSGQAVTTGALTTPTTFTLLVTNLAGDSVSQTVTVGQAAPSVTTPTPSNSTVTTGDTVHFTATTQNSANSAVTWSSSPASTFSGNSWVAPSAGTYTVTAGSVSPSGYSASTSITVVDAPVITSFTAASYTITNGSSTSLTPVFSGGTGVLSYSSTAATLTSGTAFNTGALTATTTYTLTVTNTAGKSVTRSITVNVVNGATSAPSSTMATGRTGHTVTLLTDGSVLIAGGASTTTAERYSGGTLNVVSSPMQAVRSHHTATLLADGRVLLAGGTDSSGNSSNTAELFDPVANTFTATSGSMTSARRNHSAALLPDGRVLLSGGRDVSSNAVLTAEIYDPVSDTFTAAPAMSTAREFAQATTLFTGNILVTGGDNGISATNSAQLFNGTTYSALSMTRARTLHTATLLAGGGNILVVGGSPELSSSLASSEIYSGSSLTASAALTTGIFGHTANLLASGDVFVTGGTSDGTSATSNSFIFDAIAPRVLSTASLTTARFQPASTILRNGKVLISGGSSDPTNAGSSALNSIELFDPQDNLTPALPNAILTAPSSVPDNTTGLTASVPSQTNVRYVWSLTNGTITAGLNTNSITFSRGTGPTVLSVLVVSDRQVPVQSSASISAGPAISSFTASPSTNTVGLSSTLSWSVSGGSGLTLSIDHGVGTVTGSFTTITTPGSTTTYTLTATDANGTTTRTTTLVAAAAPVATSLVAATNPVLKGSSTTVTPTFSNGTGNISGIGPVSSGVAYPTGTLNASTLFTLTATNAAGTTATTSLTVNVSSVAVASLTGPTNVTVGSSSAQYIASVTGAVDSSVTWSTSAGSITAAGLLTAPATPQDITVTATSVADSTKSATLTVHVVASPVASGLTAATNPVLYGGSTTITPQFTSGTGVINQGIGTVTSGTAYTTGAITADKTFTLTVTNASGDTATYPLTVHPQTVTVSPIAGPASGYVTVGHTASFSAAVTGAVDTSITWTATGGSFSGSTWTAPLTAGSYNITATAVSGAIHTLAVNVVPAPAISTFTASPVGVNKNQTSTLSATFTGAGTGSNATGVITPGPLSVAIGSGVATPALTSSQTYTLTVTNDAGDTATAQTTVQVFLGAFSATSNSLATPRNLPTATLEGDGNVLVAGGGSGSTTADLFSSSTLSFTSTGSLSPGRVGHTATLLPNGLTLIAGGSSGGTTLNSAVLYNPATGTFIATGSLQQARKNHSAVLLDSGKVLLVGGTGLASAELYDPVAGTFTPTGSMAVVRDFATASRLPDGRILVAGGNSGSTRLASSEIFDPSTGTFSTGATLLQARQYHSATVLPSGKILFAGGTGSTAPSNSAEIFDPSLLRFVTAGSMITPRQQHTATLLAGGMVLVTGGNNGTSSTAIDQAEIFDPSQNSFLKTDFMSTTGQPTTSAAATLLPTGQVLVTGGTTEGSSATVGSELYTPTDGLSAPAADATIVAPAYVAKAGTGVSAHVTAAAGARYIWSVTGGTLVSGQGTAGITLNMPASGNATVDVLIFTPQLIPSHGHVVVVGEPAPTITSFTAATSPVPYGGSTTVTPVFANADASAVIGTGAAGTSDVTATATSGAAVAVGPLTAPQQFRLTVANLAGVTATQTVTVNVSSVVVSAISPANPVLSAGDTRTFAAAVTQAINTGITWSATGGTIDPATGVWTAPSTPGTYTIRATAQADNTTYATTTATVVALPAIQSFTASTSPVNFGQTSSLTAVFTGAVTNHASIGTSGSGSSQLSSTVTSGTAVATAALTANTTYTLTVTNTAGASTTATVTVAVNQPFSSTGSLTLARSGETSTLLPDGSVLVGGGTAAPDVAELYTTAGNSFANTQPMQAARRNHTATLLATGQVLLTGGNDGSGNAQATAELFEPATGTFTLTPGSMSHARRNHTAALLPDGRVLIAGGSNSTENQLSSAEIFDPATATFSPVATTLTAPREFATATTLLDGRVLIAGGYTGSAHSSTADIFTTAGAFNATALSMGSARSHATATLLPSGLVLLAGGYDGTNRLTTSALFTPGSPDTFANSGSMAQARQDATATLLAGGNVLLAGGSSGSAPLATAELFSPAGTTLSGTGSLVAARTNASASLLLDGTVLVAAGTGLTGTSLNSAELFNAQDAVTPFQPAATITPSVTHAYVGTTGLTASAPTHTGNRYIWAIRNGSITAGQGTASITFSMASSGDTVLDLLVLSDHLVPAHSRATVTGDALPQITSYTAAANPLPYGGSTSLTAIFSNASGVKLGTSGYGSSDVSTSVTSGTAIPIGPLTVSTAYTLTLPTVNGNVQSQTLTVNVQPVAISAITPANPSVSAGHTATFSATVTQAMNTAVTWSATGGSITSAGVWTAPSTPGSYTITATAAANNTTAASTAATVVALPSIQSFTAAATSVSSGQSTTLTPTFTAPSGSTALIGNSGTGSSQITSTATNGTAISTGALTANTTFTLTVTNPAGDSVTQSVQVAVPQPFTATGSLATARTGQTTTVLADGSVLVAGGTSTAGPAELYSASGGTFSSTSATGSARSHHTATLLPDGRVLLIGGFDGTTELTSAEIYDPATHAFTATTGSMTHARQGHAAALLPDGRVLVLGGYNATEDALASAEIFNPVTGSFTATSSSLVNARQNATATALPNGDVLIAGGTGAQGALVSSAELFSNGAFGTQSFLMRSPRTHHTATLLPSGQVLLTGGLDSSTSLSSAELYTGGSTNSSFIAVPATLLHARYAHTATLLTSGKVLLAGGTDGTSSIAAAEIFDPSAQTFTAAGSMVTPRLNATATLLQNGKALFVGGQDSNNAPLSSTELFDPMDSLTPSLPSLQLSVPASAAFSTPVSASVTLPAQSTIVWSLNGGFITSGFGTNALNFTMPTSGPADLNVLVFTKEGLPILAGSTVAGH